MRPQPPLSHLFQGQFQVADDVVPIFQADRKADAFRVHSEGAFLLVGERRVGHREGVLDERLLDGRCTLLVP